MAMSCSGGGYSSNFADGGWGGSDASYATLTTGLGAGNIDYQPINPYDGIAYGCGGGAWNSNKGGNGGGSGGAGGISSSPAGRNAPGRGGGGGGSNGSAQGGKGGDGGGGGGGAGTNGRGGDGGSGIVLIYG